MDQNIQFRRSPHYRPPYRPPPRDFRQRFPRPPGFSPNFNVPPPGYQMRYYESMPQSLTAPRQSSEFAATARISSSQAIESSKNNFSELERWLQIVRQKSPSPKFSVSVSNYLFIFTFVHPKKKKIYIKLKRILRQLNFYQIRTQSLNCGTHCKL